MNNTTLTFIRPNGCGKSLVGHTTTRAEAKEVVRILKLNDQRLYEFPRSYGIAEADDGSHFKIYDRDSRSRT